MRIRMYPGLKLTELLWKHPLNHQLCGGTINSTYIYRHPSLTSGLPGRLYSLSLVLVPLPFDFGQHVIQSPQLRGYGVYLDPNSVRMRPRHPGPVQGLEALPLPPDVGETPDGSRQSRLGTVRLHRDLTGVKVSVLRSLQSLLQLALQQFVSPLQLMDFSEEAAEPQVEGFQHMDVGAQVVSQGAGHRARPGGDRTGRSVGEKQRVHVGTQQHPLNPVMALSGLDSTNKNLLFLSLHIPSQSHSPRTSFSLQCRCREWLGGWIWGGHHCPCWMFTPRY